MTITKRDSAKCVIKLSRTNTHSLCTGKRYGVTTLLNLKPFSNEKKLCEYLFQKHVDFEWVGVFIRA